MVLHFFPQMAQMLTFLMSMLIQVIQPLPLWSAHSISQGTPAPLTMVQTHPLPILSTMTPLPL